MYFNQLLDAACTQKLVIYTHSPLLYIFTSVWVLCALSPGRNMLFQCFCAKIAEKYSLTHFKSTMHHEHCLLVCLLGNLRPKQGYLFHRSWNRLQPVLFYLSMSVLSQWTFQNFENYIFSTKFTLNISDGAKR